MKIQSFHVFRIPSSHIIRSNYNIEMSISQARKNGELIAIAENQAIRSLFDLQKRCYNPEEIDNLIVEKRKLKGRKSTNKNIARISDIESRLNEILFIPEIVSLLIENKRHYKKIISEGFSVNGRRFVRFMCGAGHSRRNTVIFCSTDVEAELKQVLKNGIDENVEVSPNKYNAYFALNFSGTTKVSDPYFTVIGDYITTREERVDYVVETPTEDYIEERLMPLEFNAFDGQGLISVEQARRWAEELELDYVPSSFIIRNAFMKGLVVTMDFHRYSEELGEHLIDDMYGDAVNIRDMDLILTKSMFKGAPFYNSVSEYISQCVVNNMSWGISRYAPRRDYDYVFSNYQFIQNLNIDDYQIKFLCQKTIDYIGKTMGLDISYTLLYLLGKLAYDDYDPMLLDKIGDTTTKALLLNNSLITDPYIQKHVIRSLNKKIREAYIGNLVLDGNYSTMVVDPFALMEHAFGKIPKGLLKRDEHYSNYWNRKGVSSVAAMRAPLTWRSEVNILNLQNADDQQFWYQHITTGIIYNIFGVDTMLQADSDFDGDLTMTTDNSVVLKGAYGGLPITYDKGVAPKSVIKEEELYLADIKSFDSPIGIITNISTTMDAMIKSYSRDSVEYQELIKRLKLCRFYQGQAIDAAKNDNTKKMPSYWTRWTKITAGMTAEERQRAELNNRLIIDKRPFFMKHLYPRLNRKYQMHHRKYDDYCITVFEQSLDVLIDRYSRYPARLTSDEFKIIEEYYRFSPTIETDCIANKVCKFLESEVQEIKKQVKNKNLVDIIGVLTDETTDFDDDKYQKMKLLYKKYKSGKTNFAFIKDVNGKEMFSNLDQYNKMILEEGQAISADISELANLAVKICYYDYPHDTKQFVWQVFGEGVVRNVMKHRQEIVVAPFLDSQNGDIEYLGSYFKLQPLLLADPDIDEGGYDYAANI